MCGFFGAFGKLADLEKSKKALIQMSYRGPDHSSTEQIAEDVVMGHNRLAIVDLDSRSNQPFKKNNNIIIFNGEIYNFKELKNQLSQQGTQFYTTSDTEVLLEMYQERPNDFLKKLDGMFSFVIFDKVKRKLIAARDRFGEKPIFYFHGDDGIVFSSEIGPLQNFLNLKKTDYSSKSLSEYLYFGFTPSPNTIFTEIKMLEPGSYLEYDLDTKKIQINYYHVNEYTIQKIDFKDAQRRVVELIDESVKLRLLSSDVPVATFLSGGIDSSIITYTASKFVDTVKAYSISFPEDRFFDEINFAKALIKKYPNIQHQIINLTEDTMLESVDNLILKLNHPFGDSSIIPTSYLCSNVQEKVILGGDGADEVFGGYGAYSSMVQSFKLPRLIKRIVKKSFLNEHSNPALIKNPILRRAAFFASNLQESNEKEYITWRSYSKPSELKKLYQEYSHSKYNPQKIDSLNDILIEDLNFNLHNDMLMKVDYAAMFNSKEVRTPFLSDRLVQFGLSLPESFKVSGNKRKIILKAAYSPYIPSEILYRRKQGFLLPIRKWFVSGKIKNEFKELVSEQSFFEKDIISVFLDEHQRGQRDHSSVLWFIYVFLKWMNNK